MIAGFYSDIYQTNFSGPVLENEINDTMYDDVEAPKASNYLVIGTGRWEKVVATLPYKTVFRQTTCNMGGFPNACNCSRPAEI